MGELSLGRAKGGRGCLIEQPRPQGALPRLWRFPAPPPKPGKSALETRLLNRGGRLIGGFLMKVLL